MNRFGAFAFLPSVYAKYTGEYHLAVCSFSIHPTRRRNRLVPTLQPSLELWLG
jgi:hypothetical protein